MRVFAGQKVPAMKRFVYFVLQICYGFECQISTTSEREPRDCSSIKISVYEYNQIASECFVAIVVLRLLNSCLVLTVIIWLVFRRQCLRVVLSVAESRVVVCLVFISMHLIFVLMLLFHVLFLLHFHRVIACCIISFWNMRRNMF